MVSRAVESDRRSTACRREESEVGLRTSAERRRLGDRLCATVSSPWRRTLLWAAATAAEAETGVVMSSPTADAGASLTLSVPDRQRASAGQQPGAAGDDKHESSPACGKGGWPRHSRLRLPLPFLPCLAPSGAAQLVEGRFVEGAKGEQW